MGIFRDLIFASDENSENKPAEAVPVKETSLKFPTGNSPTPTTFPKSETPSFTPTTTYTPNVQASDDYVNKALDVYEKGFESLNQPGFDFFEYYKSIVSGGDLNNPQLYAMAFQMASAMDKTISKDKLLQQSDFYLTELKKVYDDYVGKGNGKKRDIQAQKESENQTLVGELELMEQQLEALKAQIEDRKRKLSAIDSKYGPMLSEVEQKIAANDTAIQKIVGSIEHVKKGIINNVK